MVDLVSHQAPMSIFWVRRDLRISDNAGLDHALMASLPVLPVFIFDTNILHALDDRTDARVTFIYDEIRALKQEFEELGSSLLILIGTPESCFQYLLDHLLIKMVFANEDYEPYGIERDRKITQILQNQNIEFKLCKDQVIFSPAQVLKTDGTPYTVYTPYQKRWRSLLEKSHIEAFKSDKRLKHLLPVSPIPMPGLEELGFRRSTLQIPSRSFPIEVIRNYEATRDYPSQATSRLGIHLRFGTISIRQLMQVATKLNATFTNELIWREFFIQVLFHFPHVIDHSFKPAYDQIIWINNEKDFIRWCEGTTGYPIVDAGMRELHATGFMHNRVRMITANFLTRFLLIDWRWGESFFASKLLDYELAANNGNWQWAAGTGCDAVPYFRIFNPAKQQEKFDPSEAYIRQWIPEFDTADYPSPMIDPERARRRAIETYRIALSSL